MESATMKHPPGRQQKSNRENDRIATKIVCLNDIRSERFSLSLFHNSALLSQTMAEAARMVGDGERRKLIP